MGDTDLSSDVGFGITSPASVPPVESHSTNDNSQTRSRRRARSNEQSGDEDPDLPENPQHQIDSLA